MKLACLTFGLYLTRVGGYPATDTRTRAPRTQWQLLSRLACKHVDFQGAIRREIFRSACPLNRYLAAELRAAKKYSNIQRVICGNVVAMPDLLRAPGGRRLRPECVGRGQAKRKKNRGTEVQTPRRNIR